MTKISKSSENLPYTFCQKYIFSASKIPLLKCQELTHPLVKGIVGDSWHLRAQGLLFCYTLANIEIQDVCMLARQPWLDSPVKSPPKKKNRRDATADTTPSSHQGHCPTPQSRTSLLTVCISDELTGNSDAASEDTI